MKSLIQIQVVLKQTKPLHGRIAKKYKQMSLYGGRNYYITFANTTTVLSGAHFIFIKGLCIHRSLQNIDEVHVSQKSQLLLGK